LASCAALNRVLFTHSLWIFPSLYNLMTDWQELPLISSCAGCGACCSFQGAPPDYVALRLNLHFAADPSFAEDVERLAELPPAAAALLEQYLAEHAQGADAEGMCVWYDTQLHQCRFYEWRPSTCRIFELSGPGCHIYRRLRGIKTECAAGNS
jgi:Fe-S-cluster containining protein